MLRLLKSLLVVLLVAGANQAAMAFSLLGPSPAAGAANAAVSWQTPALGYNPGGSDIGGPMNLGEEYRWNLPVITYAYDASFLNYFGSNGVAAVDSAIGIFNTVPAVSSLSVNLAEYPLNTTHIHYQAQALGLLDLKSAALQLLAEEMGLTQPIRYSWTLRDRRVINATTNYFVIQRNFDPVSLAPSAYVNGILYSYNIFEYVNPTYSDAVETPVNPADSFKYSVADGIQAAGLFYSGLSRDDVGGLRYIYHKNNVNLENLPPDSVIATTQIAVTNTTTLQALVTQDLALLSVRSYGTTLTTNQITALYPGILIASVFTRMTNVFITNYVGNTVTVTNGLVTNYDYTYANTVTNYSTNQTSLMIQTIQVSVNPFSSGGGPLYVTNVLSQTTVLTNLAGGQFFIVPTNAPGFAFVQPLFTNYITNATLIVTNTTSVITNLNTVVSVSNLDLATFSTTVSTNPPATVATLFTPPLFITSTNAYYTNLVTFTLATNYVYNPDAPVGTPPSIVFTTNYVTNVVQRYNYTFGNVVTNAYSPTGTVTYRTIQMLKDPYSPALSTNLYTNITYVTTTATFDNGLIYIVPTNLFGYSIINTQVVIVTTITNNIYAVQGTNSGNLFTNREDALTYATNAILTASPIGFLNPTNVTVSGPGIYQQIIQVSPSTTYLVYPITYQSSANANAGSAGLRAGINKPTFQKVSFDSLVGTAFTPVTNSYAVNTVTNGVNTLQYVRRINTQPDVLFTAADLGLLVGAGGPVVAFRTSASAWLNSNPLNANANTAGPGVITPQVVITFNNVGPMLRNFTPGFLNQASSVPYFNWGSFDGTTNAPIVYPNGNSIQNLEQQILGSP